MFAQEIVYGGYMDKFFAANHHPSISWLHDLGTGKYGAASETLLAEAQDSSDLQTRHVCLVILLDQDEILTDEL